MLMEWGECLVELRGGGGPLCSYVLHGRARRLLCNRLAIDRCAYGKNSKVTANSKTLAGCRRYGAICVRSPAFWGRWLAANLFALSGNRGRFSSKLRKIR